MNTGLLIKELRRKKGLTQEELADMTELSARTIQRIENGEVDPRSHTLQMIAKALEIDYGVFHEKEEDPIVYHDHNLTYGLMHISGILPLFFFSFLLWKMKNTKVPNLAEHYKSVMSVQLAVWVVFLLPGIFIGFFSSMMGISIIYILYYLLAGLALGLYHSVMNTILIFQGKPYVRFHILNWSGKAQKKTV